MAASGAATLSAPLVVERGKDQIAFFKIGFASRDEPTHAGWDGRRGLGLHALIVRVTERRVKTKMAHCGQSGTLPGQPCRSW